MKVIYPSGWIFTGHALQRMDEMGVLASEVHDVLQRAELSYPGYDGADGQKREVRVAGHLAVVIAPERRTIVTILWHRGERRSHLRPAA